MPHAVMKLPVVAKNTSLIAPAKINESFLLKNKPVLPVNAFFSFFFPLHGKRMSHFALSLGVGTSFYFKKCIV
jgi:hypothetical protein